MADAKISALTGATTPLAGTEVVPVVQSSSTKKVSIADLTAGRAISAADVTVSNLTASRAVATDASKKLVSVANTGTGDNVLATSPTLVTPSIGAATGTSLHVTTTLRSGDDLFAKAEMQSNGIAGGQTLFRGTPDGSGFYHAKIVGSRDASTFTYGSQLDIFTEGKNTANGTDTSTSKVTIDSLANVKVNLGNLVIGTSGKGIDFSATTEGSGTMTSELLADYEEGTWTPSLVPGTSGSISLSTANGRYTKIGNMVTVVAVVISNGVTSPVGELRLSGLPFTVGGTGGGSFAPFAYSLAATAITSLVGNPSATNTYAVISKYALGGVSNLAGDVQNGTGMLISFSYLV